MNTKPCSRQQALVVEITNAGYDRGSVCWAHHEMSRQIVERTIDNDSWFGFVCGVDDGDDPLVDEACWPKANPNFDVSIPMKYLREQVAEAVAMPTKANLVLRLNFCVWTTAETRAIDMTQWQACAPRPADAELIGAPCFAGLDLGQSDDFCALVLIWALKDGRVAVRPRFWIPRDALDKYPTRPYDAWRRANALEVTDGPNTNLDHVERAVAAECRAAGVREVAYDKRFAAQLALHLTGQGITMVDTSQGFQLNEALTRLLELVVSGNLCHGNHPVLTWMASNAVVRHGHQGEIRLDKEHAAEKIDGISALAMARSIRADAGDGSQLPDDHFGRPRPGRDVAVVNVPRRRADAAPDLEARLSTLEATVAALSARIDALPESKPVATESDMAFLLAIASSTVGGRVFSAAALFAHAAKVDDALRRALGGQSILHIGRRLHALVGRALGGLIVQRLTRDAAGIVWCVVVASDLHANAGAGSADGAR